MRWFFFLLLFEKKQEVQQFSVTEMTQNEIAENFKKNLGILVCEEALSKLSK